MNNATELKPCPFCGASLIYDPDEEPPHFYHDDPPRDDDPPRCVLDTMGVYITVDDDEEVALWNQRAALPGVKENE